MQLFSSWTGSDFVLFYVVMLGLATAAAWWIPANLRQPGRRGTPDDIEAMALLAGGRTRFTDSLLADLYVRGGLAAAGKGKFVVADTGLAASPAGKALLGTRTPFTPGEAGKLLSPHADSVAARLQRAGLLLRPEERSRLRWLSIAPLAVLLMIGLYRQRAGSVVGEPTGYLVALLVLTAGLVAIRVIRSNPRTAAGMATLRELRARNARMHRAPRAEDAAMAVALFGTGVLVGTPWEPVHAMRQQSGDGGGVDGSGEGGSVDGACGGSGCGGCGG
jgi:uncharacterized protein (TIGR04222 family)